MDRPIKQLQHKLAMLEPIKQKRNLSNTKQQLQQNNRLPRKRLLTTRKMATKKNKIRKKGKGDGSLFPVSPYINNGKGGRFLFPILGK